MRLSQIAASLRAFPWVRQHDAMQCGVAALAMICRYYGRHCSIASLDSICQANTRGISIYGLSEAARSIGFDTMCVRTTTDSLMEASSDLPAILHWNQNHFVVLYRISRSGKRFHISDPAKGKYSMSRKEFESHWISCLDDSGKGIAMILEPTAGFYESAVSKKDGDNSYNSKFRFILGYMRKYHRYFLQIGIGMLLGCVLQLLMPFLTQAIVDKGIGNSDPGFIWLILLGELMIVLGRTATDFIRRWLVLHISMRVNVSLMSDFIVRLLALPMRFFDTRHLGDILRRMADHQRIQDFMTTQALSVVFTILSLVVFGVVLSIYNTLIFGIFVLFTVIYAIWISAFLYRRRVLDYDMFEARGKSDNTNYQLVTSMQEIKLQNCERMRKWEWEDSQAALFNVQMKSLKLQQTQEGGSIFINEIKNILITVFAATAVIRGEMTLGTMMAVQYIIGQLNSPLEQIIGFVYSLQDVRISLDRISEIHESKGEEDIHGGCTEMNGPCCITLRDVVFRYDLYSPVNVLDGVSFDIPAGKTTAIVGASGSGKTTLIKLILGYYPVMSGRISISGKDIMDYSPRWWRSHCGVVMQDGVVFSDSIARNISMRDGEKEMEKLRDAARVACIDEYVDSLPLRFDTIVGRDGSGLSQGQKQRILIARAVYRNPEVILLDEATNSLDASNERRIVENLSEFYKGRTVLIVAHRLSTVKDADNIVVLDRGKVVETGTHEELTALKGYYYRLVKNQLELGL